MLQVDVGNQVIDIIVDITVNINIVKNIISNIIMNIVTVNCYCHRLGAKRGEFSAKYNGKTRYNESELDGKVFGEAFEQKKEVNELRKTRK